MQMLDRREIFSKIPVGNALVKLAERYNSSFLIKVPLFENSNLNIPDEKISFKMDFKLLENEIETSDLEFKNEIVSVVRVFNNQVTTRMIQANDKKYNEDKLFFVDDHFFLVFKDFKILEGSFDTAFINANSCILTQSAAKKYFPNESAIGKQLIYETALPLTVTAVIADPPVQTHFEFNVLVNFSTIKMVLDYHMRNWTWNPCWTYLLLHENTDSKTLENKIQKVLIDDKMKITNNLENFQYKLQPLKDIHLKSNLDYEITKNSDIRNIYIILILGGIILLIAGFNFINLTTSFSASREKEIGIKKVLGANKSSIIYQLLTESVILSLFALVISLSLVELLLPYFNQLAGKQISFTNHFQFVPVLIIIPISMLTGVVAGTWPAFYLAKFEPVDVLRKRYRVKTAKSWSRRIFVVFQLSLCTALVIISIITFRQIHFLKTTDIGFNKEKLIALSVYNQSILSNPEGFKKDLLSIKGVSSVSRSDYVPGLDHNTHLFRSKRNNEVIEHFFPALMVDKDFVKTLELKILEGRDYLSDDSVEATNTILVSEELVKFMGWTNKEAIGKSFASVMGNEKIAGVFNNFNVRPLYQPISPFILDITQINYDKAAFIKYFIIRIDDKSDVQLVQKEIEDKWNKATNNRPFEMKFISEALDEIYKGEDKSGRIYGILSLIALVIATLGLIGLTSYIIQQKTKEIGIRKILGASLPSIIILLSKEFVFLSLISNIIAWPIAYLFLTYQLKEFAFSIKISLMPFIIALLLTTLLTILITLHRSNKIAHSNPVKSLRYE